MKNKIICLITCIALFLIAIVANYVVSNNLIRYHQHEENEKTVKTDDVDEFNTHLPIISIDTDGEEIPGTDGENDMIISTVKIYNKSGDENNYLTDDPELETLSKIRVRGTTSRYFDKKNYLLKFVNEDGTKNSQSAIGMSEHNEWVLHGPYLDKTLIRNYMWYNIGGEIMDYAPNVRLCELFVNGEYKGVYVLEESISAGINRINIKDQKNSSKATGYIVRLDRGSSNQYNNLFNFTKYNYYIGIDRYVDVVYPNLDEDNEQFKTYIEQDFSEFEEALYSKDYKTTYSKYIDIDSFVDYFIINEFTQNYDAGQFSTYLYKEVNEKLKLCIWDFNSACDNYAGNPIERSGFKLTDAVWFEMLVKDETFVEKVIDRYYELRKSYLSEEYLYNYIDSTVEFLGDAVDRNFEVWGYTFESGNDPLWDERKIKSYEEAIDQMKSFIHERGSWLDENIESLYSYVDYD